MNEITLALDWSEVDVKRIGAELSKRFHGRWAGVLTVFLFVFATVVTFGVAETVSPETGSSNGIWALFVGALVFSLRARQMNRKLMKAFHAAPVRQEVSTITLNAEGITAPGAMIAGQMPWRWITEIVEREDALLLLFSPVEFIPLPDKGLPEGMTRAALKAQLETWHAAAKTEAGAA
ncbi:MAG: hypothetical protein CSA74_01335 [Rhodobacterales bacterium]|nr:MAG: hypothetical protein CSA74_01335 [Rhodobacterales bacterium]